MFKYTFIFLAIMAGLFICEKVLPKVNKRLTDFTNKLHLTCI